ncbi:hypothetical protein, unlikely [Trypanosoma brucei gambiense DAL972]|uniref:Uncharacterized protein n=1 Tax=Trypanosoma brucei gambiense (strain MHOM/CI/86/DAL972) TaxID=679716 RepID=C9ZHW9_TRYB9|nr:hypothetical protein, unlikely [Trypanosoma brucei gambiense DAL972]CBH08840.1 hypothetical protein, unlikely [Trypanosoma brucei gambiense DAL972]|eukprot:XP_011771281.1 hypothetical protein, unlikely [Trypanosoma brucei gambiense DAL972]
MLLFSLRGMRSSCRGVRWAGYNSAPDVSGRFYWIYSFCNVSLDTVGVEHRHIKTFASVLQGVSAQYYLRKHPSHSPFWPTPLSRNKGPRYCSTHRAAAGGPS